MDEITWFEAFTAKSMKEYREQNNIQIPDEYIKSTERRRMAFGIWYLIFGFILGYSIAVI